MSGALATALNVVSAAGSALSLLSGQGPVSIDNFVFQDFAVPERVQWGGSQQLSLHQFPGGAKVIDVMGYQPTDVAWSGTLLGPYAVQTAQQLDQMAQDGVLRTLVWGEQSRSVVISRFDFGQTNYKVVYNIVCCVIPDDAIGVGGVAPSPLEQIKADVNNALGFNLTGTLSQAASSLQTVSSAVTPLVGAIAPSAAAGINAGLGVAIGNLTLVSAISDAGMSAVADGNYVLNNATSLPAALAWNGLAANAHAALGYASRAALNDNAALNPPMASILSASGQVVTALQGGVVSTFSPAFQGP